MNQTLIVSKRKQNMDFLTVFLLIRSHLLKRLNFSNWNHGQKQSLKAFAIIFLTRNYFFWISRPFDHKCSYKYTNYSILRYEISALFLSDFNFPKIPLCDVIPEVDLIMRLENLNVWIPRPFLHKKNYNCFIFWKIKLSYGPFF